MPRVLSEFDDVLSVRRATRIHYVVEFAANLVVSYPLCRSRAVLSKANGSPFRCRDRVCDLLQYCLFVDAANTRLLVTFRAPSRHKPATNELVCDRGVQLKVVKLATTLRMLCE